MSRSAVDFFRDLFGGADVKSLSSRYIGFRLERVILALAQKDLNDRLCSCKDRLTCGPCPGPLRVKGLIVIVSPN